MKNVIKYIVISLIVTVMIVTSLTNIEALNYTWTWGGNRASWTYSDSGYVYPSHKIKLKSGDSLYYNGVVVTSGTGGGGIAASDNTTFTGINTFTDSLRANGYTLIDDAKITSYLRVTGEVTTDLNFNKGSSTSIGTISTDSLAFITGNTKRIIIDKNGYTVFTDTVQMLDRVYITGNLNVASNIYTIGNITADSIAGIGKFITEVDAITLKGQDTTHFARTDTLTTERVKAKTEFSDVVTFFLSPVFSALVNFANGITVTGTATFNGDIVPTWIKNESSVARDQYEKVKVVRTVMPTPTNINSVAHGITNWHTITGYTVVIFDDSTGNMISNPQNAFSTTNTTVTTWYIDSLNINIKTPAAATTISGDSVKFRITYSDYSR